jgi:hypothetical protein
MQDNYNKNLAKQILRECGKVKISGNDSNKSKLRGPFEKFVNWWKCAAVMQKGA